MDLDPIQDLFAHFNTLSPPVRRTVYHQLLDQLQLHEWRDVRDRLHQVSFHRDIVASLPLELAVQIVKHLDLSELHILRRVSQSWRSLLSSELACDAVFKKYTGPRGTSPQTRREYARQRLRLERGLPVRAIHPSLDTHSPTPSMAQMDYAKGRYAWIYDDHATLVVQDLRTRHIRAFCTENRDIFCHIRVSDSILAAITPRGYCMVWYLLDSDGDSTEPISFRIPSVNCTAFAVSGVHVAIAIDGKDRSVVHWDLHSRVAHTISVARPIAFMALNPASDLLVTAHVEETSLRITNHPLASSKDQSHPPASYTLDLPGVFAQPTPFQSTSIVGYFRLTPRQFGNQTPDEQDRIVATAYDERLDRVSVHLLPSEDVLFEDRCVAVPVDHNLLYYLKNDRGKPRVWIANPDALPAARHRPAKAVDPQLPREATSRVYSSSGAFALMGDRDFVLMVDENGLKVWCFDESVEE
ncbi:hypothetical protein BJX96DRAFT_171407 [Aspergillus floccosus]